MAIETIEELRVIVADVKAKALALESASEALSTFIIDISNLISESNPYSGTIDIDALVAIQAPIYIQKLQAIEVAADALGTDSA